MKKIYAADDLHEAIEDLERKRAAQEFELRQEMEDLYEKIRPVNIIKNTVHDVFSNGDTRNNVLRSAIGLGSGLLSKKLLVGKSAGFLKRLMGTAIQFGVAGLIAKNAERIKSRGSELISKLFTHKKNGIDS